MEPHQEGKKYILQLAMQINQIYFVCPKSLPAIRVQSLANKALQLQAKFFPEYTTGTLIRRKSSMRKKHESTTRKGTRYTVNKNKLTFLSAFLQPRSTFAVQQHG